jgi:hypothetical protein
VRSENSNPKRTRVEAAKKSARKAMFTIRMTERKRTTSRPNI